MAAEPRKAARRLQSHDMAGEEERGGEIVRAAAAVAPQWALVVNAFKRVALTWADRADAGIDLAIGAVDPEADSDLPRLRHASHCAAVLASESRRELKATLDKLDAVEQRLEQLLLDDTPDSATTATTTEGHKPHG